MSLLFLPLTLIIYYAAVRLYKRFPHPLLAPFLISLIIIIAILLITGIGYSSYQKGTKALTFFLDPGIVALAYPLFTSLSEVRRQFIPIITSVVVGAVVGIIVSISVLYLLGGNAQMLATIAPRAVTTPIAMEVSRMIAGKPGLTASLVIIAGLFGSVGGFSLFKLLKVRSEAAMGMALGSASHALGTAKAAEINPKIAAFSSIALILSAITTALLAPVIQWFIHLLTQS
ncbi:LrgB family protein [Celerinatantimonas sp. MCCC 1A17872]|uniref:LrgB family protein n=1 Tax=Celerinatantimonas sp. MCCC 1A17872 TaxID=3177514 RepID=UPI0038C7B440